MKKWICSLVLCLSLTLLFFIATDAFCEASQTAQALLAEADQCRKGLDKSGETKSRNYWFECIGLYKNIYVKYPKTDQAAWALYHSARLYTGLFDYSKRSQDLDSALELYRRLAEEYKDHRLADDAQYLIGMIFNVNRNDPSQAYVEFLKVEVNFPSGDMVPEAKKRLEEISVTLGDKVNKKEDEDKGKDNAENKEENKEKVKENTASQNSNLIAVTDIRHWSTPNYTRVVVYLEDSVQYEHHLIKADPDVKKPRRLYLDLKNARVPKEINSRIEIKDGLLQMARAAQYSSDTVRVVLDMESVDGFNVFSLLDPFRIVLDVRRDKKTENENKDLASTGKERVRKGIRKSEKPDTKVSLARQLGLSVRRIVIDPGHGGKDPGCQIGDGIKEKDIVLKLAKALASKIRAEMGCEVFLTRSTDIFLSLEQRTAIANMKKADLFVSLHINAHQSSDIWGLETYFLNMATDETSVMVAARENATSQKNISDLQTILNELMMNTKINESSRLAHEVQKGMITLTDTKYKTSKDLGVKQAPFYVLIGAEMPAILVESGFLTNPTERKRLLSNEYYVCIATGICKGIKDYVKGIELVYQGGGG
jgi:N-acetylmuramoyl-L-alanine amidase